MPSLAPCSPRTTISFGGLDQSGKPGNLRPTVAFMAKVVPDLWSFEPLYNEVIQYG
jgi:hypothetical protein